MIRNIIFDFDGTLAETSTLILESMKAAVEEMDLPRKSIDDYKKMIGIRLEDMPELLWPDLGVDKQEFVDSYRRNFDRYKNIHRVEAFDKVIETLKELHISGKKMAIATSRSVASLKNFLNELDISEYFDKLVGGEDVKNGKPSPDPVLLITDAFSWDPAETLVVGDMPVDILMGKSAGCKTVGVSYGNSAEKDLIEAGADYVIDKFVDLKKYL